MNSNKRPQTSRLPILGGTRRSRSAGSSSIHQRTSSTSKRSCSVSRSGLPPRILLFRSSSDLETPLRSTGRPTKNVKLETPQARLESKSPQRLKFQYTNLNEKIHVERIARFIEEQESSLEVTKPVKMNDFVAITQVFFSVLCSLSQPKLTMKNYKVELPNVMKLLKYPITINQSFLKSPNTPQHFSNVLSIWTYLMDIVDVNSEKVTGQEIPTLLYQCAVQSTENEPQALKNFKDGIYEIYGTTEEDFIVRFDQAMSNQYTLKAARTERENEIQLLGNILQSKDENLKSLIMERAEVGDKKNEIQEDIQAANDKLHHNKQRLKHMQNEEMQELENLETIKKRVCDIGHTPAEIGNLDREIERKSHFRDLLEKRNEEYQTQCQLHQDQQTQLQKQLVEEIFAFNKKIAMCSLPEGEKMYLKLNETEVNTTQRNQVAERISKLVQDAEKEKLNFKELLNDENNVLLALEENLAQLVSAAEDRSMQRAAKRMQLEEVNAQNAELLKLQRIEENKVTRLRKLYKIAGDNHNAAVVAMKQHKIDTEQAMQQIKEYTDETNAHLNSLISKHMKLQLEINNNIARNHPDVADFQ